MEIHTGSDHHEPADQRINCITYTGQMYDGALGQYYLRARFYNPTIGRFLQEDVYRGDGLNLYAYCANNPVMYYDPSGYMGLCVAEGESRDLEKGDLPEGRMDLAGKRHPVSGVEFDLNGYPIFESKYDMQLNPEDYLKSRGTHFERASKALYNDIMKDKNLKSQFTEVEIATFRRGGLPKAYTWHHNQNVGKLQLVNRKIHRQTGHTGGFSIWGPGN